MSSVPVLFHHFASVEDARAATESAPDRVRLRVPYSFPLKNEQTVVLLFRAGDGWTFQATGTVEDLDKEMEIATIGFQGHEGLVIEDALERSSFPLRPRKFARYRCWDAVTLRTQCGHVISGIACDVAVGGIRATMLSGRMSAGDSVEVDFGKGGRSVAARVQWSSIRGLAGLAFVDNPATMPLVRRIVSEAAAHGTRNAREGATLAIAAGVGN